MRVDEYPAPSESAQPPGLKLFSIFLATKNLSRRNAVYRSTLRRSHQQIHQQIVTLRHPSSVPHKQEVHDVGEY